VPLSEDEQRILQDIERSFYENDPGFAKVVGRAVSRGHAARNCKIAVGGAVAGFALLLATFTTAPAAAFVGFVLMVAGTGFFVRNFRHLTASRSDKTPGTPGAEGRTDRVSGSIGEARSRIRELFRRR